MKKILSIVLTIIMLVLPVAETAVSAIPSAVETADVPLEVILEEDVYEADTALAAEVTYNVSFNANGGINAPLYQKKIEGRNLVIKDAMPTRSGYTFAGWATSADSQTAEYLPGSVYTQDKDITLYAIWTDEFGGYEPTAADYQVVATPHNSLGDEEFTYNYGYECLVLNLKSTNNANCPNTIILTPEQLGIPEGTSDNYFLNVFSLLMMLDEYGDIHSVIAAQNKAVKKTVTELELCEVTTNTASSYFPDSDGNAKLLSGEVIADGESFYVFNAPATYANETYPTGITEYEKYLIRNSKNIEFISFDMTEEDGQFCYSAYIDEIVSQPDYDEVDRGYFENQALEFLYNFKNAYYGGLYEADLYDIDGDGLYDYIDYKPYTFFRVDSDEDEFFEDSDFGGYDSDTGIPYIYTNEASVIGETFDDGDFVIGYFNANLELIKIASVIKPTIDYVRSFKKTTGTITLGGGQVIDAVSSWRYINNDYREIVWDIDAMTKEIVYHSDLFSSAILDGDKITFYTYNNILLFTEAYDNSTKYTGNLIIPTDIKSVRNTFDTAAGEDIWYVYAWIDGNAKYIPVETDNVYPEIIDEYSDRLTYEYANKLCTYTVDEDGIYTVKSLGYSVKDEDYEYDGISQDIEVLDDEKKDTQFYGELSETTVTKIAGSRFDIGFERTVNIIDDTKIVLRSYSDDKYTFVEYDAASFKESLDFYIYNVSFVIENNPDSAARENLLLLYGETDEPLTGGSVIEPTEKSEITASDVKERLIVPTDIRSPRSTFNTSIGKDVWYIYAYVDGSAKYIPVDNDSTYPEIIDEDYEVLTEAYANKLCVYTLDENELYTIRSLGYDENTDGEYTGVNTDVSAMDSDNGNALLYSEMYIADITRTSESSLSFDALDFDVNLSDNTKIVIRAMEEDDNGDIHYEYIEFDASTFINSISDETTFVNIGMVLSNNTSSTTSENLIALYAETDSISIGDDDTEEPVIKGEITLDDIKDNIIIPTDIKRPVNTFDASTGKDMWYVYAWVDGSTKYVPVDLDSSYPEIIDEDIGWLTYEYANKPCTYTITDGIYTIRSLGYDENTDAEYTGISWDAFDDDDDNAMFYSELSETYISKIAGTRYDIEGLNESVDLTSDTKIIIRTEEYATDGDINFEYIEFDATTLPSSIASILVNVSLVVDNNPYYTHRENLVLLYAETDILEVNHKLDSNSYRIVSNVDIGQDADGNWRHYYELYNPYTGAKEIDIPSIYCASKAANLGSGYYAGTIIQLIDGMVSDNDKYIAGEIDTSNLIWISDVFEDDNIFAAVPYNDFIMYPEEIEEWMEYSCDDQIMDIYGEEIPGNYIAYDDNTVVSIMSYSNLNSMWNWGNMSLSDMGTVAAKKKNVLSYNEKAIDRNGNYVTLYSNYVKAYVSVDTENLEDELPVADYIIIIVNGDEPSALFGKNFGQSSTVSVTGVTINKTNLSIEEGKKETLTATVSPSNATDKTVTWTSSDNSIATVHGGVVTAIKEGVAKITVTTSDGAKAATCTVTVTKPEEPKATIRLSDTVGRAGETVSVIVSLSTDELINTVGVTGITYNTDVLTFDSFTQYDEIKELTTLQSFDKENMTVVLAFKLPQSFSGDLLELNFVINENAQDGKNEIDVSSLIKLDYTEITVNDIAGSVTVVSEAVGDINHDELIDMNDAILLLQHSMFPAIYPIEYKGNVDFTKDGHIDMNDAVLLLQHSMFPDIYPISYN